MKMQQPYPSDTEACALLVEIGRRMYHQGYVVTNDGNMSLKVSPTTLWITPTGVSKGYMDAENMVKMDLEGNVIGGGGRPSSESKMHLRVYRENPAVQAVVHAHPTAATAFAVAGVPLDLPILIEASVQLGAVPVARYALPGSQGVPDSIAPFCRDYAAVLLSNHGALTWGRSLMEAFHRLEILENYAKTTLNLMAIGRLRPLSRDQMDELRALKDRLGFTDGVLQTGAPEASNLTDVLPGEAGSACIPEKR